MQKNESAEFLSSVSLQERGFLNRHVSQERQQQDGIQDQLMLCSVTWSRQEGAHNRVQQELAEVVHVVTQQRCQRDVHRQGLRHPQ